MSLLILLAQCVCMFIASFAVGSLPLMSKSATQGKRLKSISTLGMGLLVGAALTIIIPEGVSTVFEALGESEDEHQRETTTHAIGLALLAGFALMLLIESLMPHPPESPPPSPPSTPDRASGSRPASINSLDHEHEYQDRRPLPSHVNSSTPIIQKKRMHIEDGLDRESLSGGSAVHGLNATLGLVIHGAADGIALGASSLSGRGSLGLVVFLAVLVHKGPTALGLTTTLMSLRLSPPMIRRRLLIFSFAAPLGAVITFFIVKAFGWGGVGQANGEIDSLGWWTGIALLFSGGSFLYVATVIQPLSSDSHSHNHQPDDTVELGKYERTGLLIVGMLGPVCLSWIVGDAH